MFRDGGDRPTLVDVPGFVLNAVASAFDAAVDNFFKGRGDRPKIHKRNDSISFQDGFRFVDTRTRSVRSGPTVYGVVSLPCPRSIPKVAWQRLGFEIEFRRHRPWRGKPKMVTISRVADRWYVSILCEWEAKEPVHRHPGSSIGVDVNVANLCATSEGTIYEGRGTDRIEQLIRRRQRKAARCKKGSKNRRKAYQRVAKLKAKQACARHDTVRKTAHDIARQYEMIAREDLSIVNMTRSAKGTADESGKNVRQKAGLNRAILNQGWGALFMRLDQKTAAFGGHVVKVAPHGTSQTCSECWHRDPDSRDDRKFRCVRCDAALHADVNSAKNILVRALGSQQPTVSGLLPVEGKATRSRRSRKRPPRGGATEQQAPLTNRSVVRVSREALATERRGNSTGLGGDMHDVDGSCAEGHEPTRRLGGKYTDVL